MVGRTDRVQDADVVGELLLARRGQAYFSRRLRQVADVDFDAPASQPGTTRREVVARVGLHARMLAVRIEELAGIDVEESWRISSPEEWETAVAFTATLPPSALRHLAEHAGVHLSVAWRDLSPSLWPKFVTDVDGVRRSVAETLHDRAAEVWLGGIALGPSPWDGDLPTALAQRLRFRPEGAWLRRATVGV